MRANLEHLVERVDQIDELCVEREQNNKEGLCSLIIVYVYVFFSCPRIPVCED